MLLCVYVAIVGTQDQSISPGNRHAMLSAVTSLLFGLSDRLVAFLFLADGVSYAKDAGIDSIAVDHHKALLVFQSGILSQWSAPNLLQKPLKDGCIPRSLAYGRQGSGCGCSGRAQ